MLLRSLVLVVALAAAPHAASGQGLSPQQAPDAGARWARASGVSADLYDIEFAGGTIRSYYEGLRSIVPTLNLIDVQNLAEERMPPVVLTAVTLPTIIQVPQTLVPSIHVEIRGQAQSLVRGRQTDLIAVLHRIQRAETRPAFTPFDVHFPGGSLSEYADALRKANPDVSIVIAPTAANLAVPPLELKNVTTTAAVKILESFYVPAREGDFRVVVDAVRTGSGDDVVMAIGASGGDASLARRGDTTPRQRVWSIGEALDRDAKVEDILAAVELSQSLLPAQATIKYHAPSRLLIAVGTDEQLMAIHEVVDTIIRDAHNRPRREQAPAQPAPR